MEPILVAVIITVALVAVGRWLWGIGPILAANEPNIVDQSQDSQKANTQRAGDTRLHQASRRAGLERLSDRLGAEVPVGSGIIAGHVEGLGGDYMPRQHAGEFSGLTFLAKSGQSKANSHAHGTSRVIYGPKGLAPGVSQVHCYSADHFLGLGYLRSGTAHPPVRSEARVFNHSWVYRNVISVGDVLRRADYVIDTHDVVMVVGVDNGRDSKVPAILSSAFNVIAVGNWTGDSSGGYSVVETSGRCKPDIVAPGNQTSFSTPVVSAMVIRALELADTLDPRRQPQRAEVIKASLLAGAVKPDGWRSRENKPLDPHFGAGRIDIDNSFSILTSECCDVGQSTPPSVQHGWNFSSIQRHQIDSYPFTIPRSSEVSISLVWHRRVIGRPSVNKKTNTTLWMSAARLADLDLQLVQIGLQTPSQVVARSTSKVDNVENIFRRTLPAGQYRIEVIRQDGSREPWEYAIAWRYKSKDLPVARAGR